ncbi:MAG: LA_2272 family surface repeat-containing protein [Kiritimatiellia bacterium]
MNSMMKRMAFVLAAAASMAAAAQVVTPSSAVANDHGTGGTRPVSVAYAPRTVESGYGYVDGMTVFGLTLLPWSLPNPSFDVTGVRLNLGWGGYRNGVGLDAGLFSAGQTAKALQINLLGNWTADFATGWQNGLVNVAGGHVCGVQIGLVNVADSLEGVQIGLLNFVRTRQFFPIVNLGW